MALQRFDDARQQVQLALAGKLDDYILHLLLYALGFLKGDSAAVTQQQQWFSAHTDVAHFGLSLDSDSAAYAGRLNQAQALTRQAVESAVQADSNENGWYLVGECRTSGSRLRGIRSSPPECGGRR